MSVKGDLVGALVTELRARHGCYLNEQEGRRLLERVFELAGTSSCFVNAADEEPIFVLRAHDNSAAQVVEYWARLNRLSGKRNEAELCAAEMQDWQRVHGCKTPD